MTENSSSQLRKAAPTVITAYTYYGRKDTALEERKKEETRAYTDPKKNDGRRYFALIARRRLPENQR